jgi:hypothetical protein
LKPSNVEPSLLAWARVASVTLALPQIIGTNSTPGGAGSSLLFGDQL